MTRDLLPPAPTDQQEVNTVVKALPKVEELKGFSMLPQDFEKVWIT